MISTVIFQFKTWQIASNHTDDCGEIKDNHCVGSSFGRVCAFMLYSGFRLGTGPHRLSPVKCLNRKLCRGLAHYQASMLAFTPSRRVDLSVFTASHLKPTHYRIETGCAGLPNKTGCPWKGSEAGTFVDWFATWDAGQDNRIWTLIRKRGLFSTNSVWEISSSLIGEPCTAMTPATTEWWKMKLDLIQFNFSFAYKEVLGCKSQQVESCRKEYNLVRLYKSLYNMYNTATIMITITRLTKKECIKLNVFTHSPPILTSSFSTVALNHVRACFFEVYFKWLQAQNEKRMLL